MPLWLSIVLGIACFWLLCGLWGYGVSKGLSQSIILRRDWVSKYGRDQERSNKINILFGPLFLLGMALLVWDTKVHHHIPYVGVRFVMPDEFCEKGE